MQELEWIKEAKKHLGLKEIVGTKAHNPTIVQWLKDMGTFPGAAKSWYFEDETPWCGLFVGHCLGNSGRAVIKDWYRAKAWASAGLTKLEKPAYGCMAVKSRKSGGLRLNVMFCHLLRQPPRMAQVRRDYESCRISESAYR